MQEQQQESAGAQIINTPKRVKAFGNEYEIKRLTLGPLIRALPYLSPLGYLMRLAGQPIDAGVIATNILALGGEPALGLISVVTQEPIEWLEDKDPVEAMGLLAEIVEANVPYFFDSANLEQLKSVFVRLGKVVEENLPKQNSGESSTLQSPVDTAH